MLGELYSRCPDAEAFRLAVEALGGDFVLDAAEMIELGEAYFRRHPDTSCNRDRESVLAGYALVRLCVTERLIRRLSPAERELYRGVFQNPGKVGVLSGRFSNDELQAGLASVEAAMAEIRESIEGIPKGPVKERFIGGISHLCTVLYLIRLHLDKRAPGQGSGQSGGGKS